MTDGRLRDVPAISTPVFCGVSICRTWRPAKPRTGACYYIWIFRANSEIAWQVPTWEPPRRRLDHPSQFLVTEEVMYLLNHPCVSEQVCDKVEFERVGGRVARERVRVGRDGRRTGAHNRKTRTGTKTRGKTDQLHLHCDWLLLVQQIDKLAARTASYTILLLPKFCVLGPSRTTRPGFHSTPMASRARIFMAWLGALNCRFLGVPCYEYPQQYVSIRGKVNKSWRWYEECRIGIPKG